MITQWVSKQETVKQPVDRMFWFVLVLLCITGCTTTPPKHQNNLCEIFYEKDDWYEDAANARDNWRSPIPVMMAIMYQESRFQSKSKPPRKKILGFIPGPRPTSSYGYSQAKKTTWDGYKRSSGQYGADRDDFSDAIDFIGWYNNTSQKRCGISPSDAYHLYLAYHEGHGGFNRRSFKNKTWLKAVAKKVSSRSKRYDAQLELCEEQLKEPWWHLW